MSGNSNRKKKWRGRDQKKMSNCEKRDIKNG